MSFNLNENEKEGFKKKTKEKQLNRVRKKEKVVQANSSLGAFSYFVHLVNLKYPTTHSPARCAAAQHVCVSMCVFTWHQHRCIMP